MAINPKQLGQQIVSNEPKLEKKNAPRGFILGDDGFYAPREYTDEEMKSGYDLVLSHLQSGGHLDDEFFKNNPDVPSDVIYSAYGKFKEGKSSEPSWKPTNQKITKSRLSGVPWIDFSEGDYSGQAKLYDRPSDYGINGGRVSKLYLTHKGQPIANYDRGWGTEDNKFEIAPEHKDFYDKILNYLESFKI